MDFMDLPPHRRRRKLVRHVMIASTTILTLIVFRFADDNVTGKAKVSDAYGFTLIFLVTGYFVASLSEIWEKCKRTPVEPFLLPIFMALLLFYLYFGFRSYFIQPGAVCLTVCLQLFVIVCLLCQAE